MVTNSHDSTVAKSYKSPICPLQQIKGDRSNSINHQGQGRSQAIWQVGSLRTKGGPSFI